ncbi:MAG: TIGR00730 family Rossman fold protein [Deltaproteobacteria bacterium]|nr:TIGR00730 family Rossman fold protein [Deltaproteobacteria bacterium]
MIQNKKKTEPFPSALEDARAAELCIPSPQTLSPSYRLAYRDHDFLLKDELRPVRLQLELLKPELILREHGIERTIIVFGSARIPEPKAAHEQLAEMEAAARKDPTNESLARKVGIARRVADKSKYYEEARRLASLISQAGKALDKPHDVLVTGGGPGIMEAANRGAYDAGTESIGLNIVLPFEQKPNAYITPDLCFQFHYFAIRKMHFLMRAKALVVFPGGYGTLDELFETLTLIQTRKIKPIPVLIFGREFWEKIINFDALVDEGTISPEDIELFQYVETAEQAWEIISRIYDVSQKS